MSTDQDREQLPIVYLHKVQLTFCSFTVPPLLLSNSSLTLVSNSFPSSSSNLLLSLNITTALLYMYISGGIAQHTGNHKLLPNFGRMLAYSQEVEISRRLYKSFALTWKVLEVKI